MPRVSKCGGRGDTHPCKMCLRLRKILVVKSKTSKINAFYLIVKSVDSTFVPGKQLDFRKCAQCQTQFTEDAQQQCIYDGIISISFIINHY